MKRMPVPSPFRARVDPDVGEFEDAVILKAFGEVPADLISLVA
jgi:hypothetical protein